MTSVQFYKSEQKNTYFSTELQFRKLILSCRFVDGSQELDASQVVPWFCSNQRRNFDFPRYYQEIPYGVVIPSASRATLNHFTEILVNTSIPT